MGCVSSSSSSASRQQGPRSGGASQGKRNETKSSAIQERIDRASKSGALALVDAKLAEVPPAVLRLEKLRSLDLSTNSIGALPDALGATLVALKTLSLCKNRLSALPHSIGSLTKLSVLKVDDNKLEDLPPQLPSSLKTISLARNRLTSVPACLGTCTGLVDIVLSGNSISTLPGVLGELPKLVSLDASDNMISEIEVGVGASPTLQILIISGNNLDSVPEYVLRAKSIARMRLENNKPGLTKESLMKTPGWEEFDKRRMGLIDKQLAGGMTNTDRSICGLE